MAHKHARTRVCTRTPQPTWGFSLTSPRPHHDEWASLTETKASQSSYAWAPSPNIQGLVQTNKPRRPVASALPLSPGSCRMHTAASSVHTNLLLFVSLWPPAAMASHLDLSSFPQRSSLYFICSSNTILQASAKCAVSHNSGHVTILLKSFWVTGQYWAPGFSSQENTSSTQDSIHQNSCTFYQHGSSNSALPSLA